MPHKHEVTKKELATITGGMVPIAIATGLGSLAVSAFNVGYKFGSDLARRGQ